MLTAVRCILQRAAAFLKEQSSGITRMPDRERMEISMVRVVRVLLTTNIIGVLNLAAQKLNLELNLIGQLSW
jgi:hypothetical protein